MDVPALCDFLVPSVVARGELVIAISTGGKSPALARRIREELEARYTEEDAWLLDLLGEMRPAMRKRFPASAERRGAFWEALLTDDFLELVRQGDQSAVRRKVAECISQLSD